jgi:hypothetical protein
MVSTSNEGSEIALDIVGFFLMLSPFYAYYKLVTKTHENLYRKSLRLSVLSCRTALFLPTYSFIIWLSLIVPWLYFPLEVPISVAEGYSFYAFFALVTTNLGGARKACAVLEKLFGDGKRPLCPCCCPSKGTVFYRRVYNALWHFINTRTVFVLISVVLQCIFTFNENLDAARLRRMKIASYLLTAIALILLGNGFGSLVMYYEVMYGVSKNLMATFKLLLLKFSVGLIVIQGLIEEILWVLQVIPISPSSLYSAEDRSQRFYCFIVLLEYAFLAIAVYYAYSPEIKPASINLLIDEDAAMTSPSASLVVKSPITGQLTGTDVTNLHGNIAGSTDTAVTNNLRVSGTGIDVELEKANITMREYLRLIFSLRDVWDGLEPPVVDPDQLTTPLNDKSDYREDQSNVV